MKNCSQQSINNQTSWIIFLVNLRAWQSVLLVEKTGVHEKTTNLSQVTDTLHHIMLYRAQLACAGFQLATLVVMLIFAI
jgi:hypothetical protein